MACGIPLPWELGKTRWVSQAERPIPSGVTRSEAYRQRWIIAANTRCASSASMARTTGAAPTTTPPSKKISRRCVRAEWSRRRLAEKNAVIDIQIVRTVSEQGHERHVADGTFHCGC